MNQATLFTKTLCHKNDPETSRQAAQKMIESGKLNKQEMKIYEFACRFCRCYPCFRNGFTAKELSNWSKIDYYIIQRRLSGLYRKGKIERLAEDGSVWLEGCGKKKMVRDGCCVWRLA